MKNQLEKETVETGKPPRHNSRMRRLLANYTTTMVPLNLGGKENQRKGLRKHGHNPKYSGKNKCFYI